MPAMLRRLLTPRLRHDRSPPVEDERPLRLHVGAGRERMEGWINIDLQDLPGVDVVADVTRGLDFTGVEAVYAEHFLEHLRVDQGVDFLVECNRCLAPGGLLRLSTPNLDWVWLTHYRVEAPAEEKRRQALATNRAFRGWGHQFVWNRELLATALEACGFDQLRWCRWGESGRPMFQGIERHETYQDTADLPHVLIVEAVRAEPRPASLAELRQQIGEELLVHLEG